MQLLLNETNSPAIRKLIMQDISLCTNVGLIKLFPGMTEDVISFMIERYDALVIECFGVGGLPEYYEFYSNLKKAAQKGTLFVITTQVPNDGSDLGLYSVGERLRQAPNVLEARDMTSESCLAKLMWILGQTKDTSRARTMFKTPVGHDLIR